MHVWSRAQLQVKFRKYLWYIFFIGFIYYHIYLPVTKYLWMDIKILGALLAIDPCVFFTFHSFFWRVDFSRHFRPFPDLFTHFLVTAQLFDIKGGHS